MTTEAWTQVQARLSEVKADPNYSRPYGEGFEDGASFVMDNMVKEYILDFLKFREEFKKKETDKIRQEYLRLGGPFSWIPVSDEAIYEIYLLQ